MQYAMWYDNGSGYFDAHELRDKLKFDNYPYRQVATAGWEYNPNVDAGHILAESGDVIRKFHVTMNTGESQEMQTEDDYTVTLYASSEERAEKAVSRMKLAGYMMHVTEAKPDAILVGRHASDDLPYNIVEQRNVVFATDVNECKTQVEELFAAAHEAEAVLLFQNIPGIVACAMTQIAARNIPTHLRGVGVIISKPGPREVGKEMKVEIPELFYANMNGPDAKAVYQRVKDAVAFVNPNAKIDGDKITVDAPMKFVFEKVEWLF